MDRNKWIKNKYPGCRLSLSARRAWIEIIDSLGSRIYDMVALRKESVDRNRDALKYLRSAHVALRKESVDRNTQRRDFKRLGLRRSPQGERG